MRQLVPEILDSLAPGDPEAVRSRRDLRRLDVVLGGSRWILSRLSRHRSAVRRGVVEVGAGEGGLCRRVSEAFPGAPFVGMDFLPAPAGLPAQVRWEQGDFFERLPGVPGEVLIGSLILHHFHDRELSALAPHLDRFRVLLFSEPWRSRSALALASLAHPFVGRVTRHDMPASIRAGFRPGELADVLKLAGRGWKIRESLWPAGTIRFEAWRDI